MNQLLMVLPLVLLAACRSTVTPAAAADPVHIQLASRADAIAAAVTRWQSAPDLPAAKAAAEEARNLVLGQNGPGYGDTDGDGTIRGSTSVGLLPGAKGEVGLANTGKVSACVARDVLGGSWNDAAARWAQATEAVQAWTPSNNPFPMLKSHPQRIYGWASLTLSSSSLKDAHRFAGHAQIHVSVTRGAIRDC